MDSYKILVSFLNKCQGKNEKKFDDALNHFTSETIKSHTNVEWIPVPKDIADKTIVVLAHGDREIRAMGYVFRLANGKLVFKRITFHHRTNKLIIDRKSRKSLEIYTCRRGFWVVMKLSLDLNLNMSTLLNPNTENVLRDHYNKFVRGMEKRPLNESLIHGFEQFKIGEYPTAEWKKSVDDALDESDAKMKRPSYPKPAKRARKDMEEESEDSSAEYQENDIKDNESEYVVVRSVMKKFEDPVYELQITPDNIQCISAIHSIADSMFLLNESTSNPPVFPNNPSNLEPV